MVNRLVGEDAGDLLLGDEGRGDGVGGGQRTNENAPVKSVKEIRSSDHCKCLKSVFLSIHQCMKWGIIYEIEYFFLMFYDTCFNR